jgi:D-hydroxyproline dehydrogenase subunit beta
MAYDVAIVGAGIVGAACAASLSARRFRTIVIEAGGVASGATAAGMGHIVVMDDSEAQFALTKYSRGLWSDLADELPPSGEYEACGTIWVAADDDEMNALRSKKEFYETRGVPADILDEKQLLSAEPNLRPGLAGGLRVESDSVVYQLCAAQFLLDRAIGAGAELATGKKVVEIRDNGALLDNGDFIAAGKVVNAAGVAAPELSPQLKIARRKGHLVITGRYPGFVRHQLVEIGYLRSAHSADGESVAFNIQPRMTGQVLVGSSRQFGREGSEIDHKILRRMAARGFEYMPALRDLKALRVWTGFRPATPDNLPYIGKLPGRENVYVAAGHEGLGITTSLGTAALLADQISGRECAIPPAPYSPARAFLKDS